MSPSEHAEHLIRNPGCLTRHWFEAQGIFDAVYDNHCPVVIRQYNMTTGIRAIDVILDGGDDEGNRIPKTSHFLFHRWRRAGKLPHTERIRRKILRPFVLIREAYNTHAAETEVPDLWEGAKERSY
jgi:hypothetical protein